MRIFRQPISNQLLTTTEPFFRVIASPKYPMDGPQHYQSLSYALQPPASTSTRPLSNIYAQPTNNDHQQSNYAQPQKHRMQHPSTAHQEEEEDEDDEDDDEEGLVEEQLNRNNDPDMHSSDPSSPKPTRYPTYLLTRAETLKKRHVAMPRHNNIPITECKMSKHHQHPSKNVDPGGREDPKIGAHVLVLANRKTSSIIRARTQPPRRYRQARRQQRLHQHLRLLLHNTRTSVLIINSTTNFNGVCSIFALNFMGQPKSLW